MKWKGVVIKHSWSNRIIPPVVIASIVTCVGYSLANRPKPTVALPSQQTTSNVPQQSVMSSSKPIAEIPTMVSKIGDQVEFSIDTKTLTHVQKVEFYVEDRLVGATFALPYSLSIAENNLSAGTHTAVAKVYTDKATAQTTPALFTADPKSPPPFDPDTTATVVPATPPPSTIAAPTGLVITAGSDSTNAQLSWQASDGATSYQIWRDGIQIAIATTNAYLDTRLNPGQTYDYQIAAVTPSSVSSLSAHKAVTMPVSQHPTSAKPSGAPNSSTTDSTPSVSATDNSSPSPNIQPTDTTNQ